jgi:hypothetical protein
MAAVASTEMRQLVTRHILFVISEGVPRLALDDGREMTATVRLERHTSEPALVGPPWRHTGRGIWDLTSGHLAVTDIEGLLDWLSDVGLHAGPWNAQVSSTGGIEASALEDRILEEDPIDVTDGPEEFLVQLWPTAAPGCRMLSPPQD